MNEFLNIIRESLDSITNPHFYKTERGFQGELISEIRQRLPELEIDGVVVEQEYQKRMKDHGFRIRPDILIHIPFEQAALNSRREGNFVVIELKQNATKAEALADYSNLSSMCSALNYPLAIFINIGASCTYLSDYANADKVNIHAFGVRLSDGHVEIVENEA